MQRADLKRLIPAGVKSQLLKLRRSSKWIKKMYAVKTASINPAPVVVLGVQKSGTTAIAVLLGKATGKVVWSDFVHLNDITIQKKFFYKQMRFGDFLRRNRFYFSVDIVKDPNLTFFIDELLDYFPKAKVIFVVRDPRDNIRSILNRLKLPGNLRKLNGRRSGNTYSVEHWQMIIDGRLPHVPGDSYIERLAYRWNLAADLYFENMSDVHLIRYEDFLKDKVRGIGRLAKQVGLEITSDISGQVDVQYQPKGDRDVAWLEFFGEDNLCRIETICGQRMKRFSYAVSKSADR